MKFSVPWFHVFEPYDEVAQFLERQEKDKTQMSLKTGITLGLTTFGHWLASIGKKIVSIEKDIAPAAQAAAAELTKVGGYAGTIESLTSLFSPGAADAERVVFGAFGILHDTLTDTANAANAPLNAQLDAQVKADILATGQYFATHPLAGPVPVGLVATPVALVPIAVVATATSTK